MSESTIQRFVGLFASRKKKAEIKRQSMLWGFTCPTCKKRTSIWEIGGVRYKANGNPKKLIKCPGCGTKELQHINKLVD